jgi:hypothetical protein
VLVISADQIQTFGFWSLVTGNWQLVACFNKKAFSRLSCYPQTICQQQEARGQQQTNSSIILHDPLLHSETQPREAHLLRIR